MLSPDQINIVLTSMHALVFASARLIAMFSVLPLFSQQMLPGLVRSVFLLTLSFTLVPIVHADMQALQPSALETLLITAKESFIGIVMGMIGASLFWAVEGAGFLIDNQRGASLASIVDPLSGNQTSPMGLFLLQAFLTYFVAIGGITILLGGLYASYEIWPVFSFMPDISLDRSVIFIERLDWLMRTAFILCAPVMIAMFLTELAVGLIGRFTPQLNVFFISMPLKSAVAMALLALYVTLIFRYFDGDITALGHIDDTVKRIIE